MDPEQRLRIRKNFSLLAQNLEAETITDNLFTSSVIEHDDLQRVYAESTDSDKAKRLINIVITKEGAYEPLLKEIESLRPDLVKHLKDVNVEEELEKERENRLQFLRDVVRKRFVFAEEKFVTESDILYVISFEYWRAEKGIIPEETKFDLVECFRELIPRAIRKKSSKKNKKEWRYYNIERKEWETSDDDEGDMKRNDQASANDDFGKSPPEESPNTYETCSAKYFRDINSSHDLKTLLDPYFENKRIDKKYLEILDQEKIDGNILIGCDMDDLDKLFPDMPFGDKKRVLGIVKSILEEETKSGPFLQILSKNILQTESVDQGENRFDRGTSEDDENDLETKFKEIFRTFDTSAKAEDAYRRHAVFRTSNFFVSDLIEPVHKFSHNDDPDESSLSKWIAKETLQFACACFADRTNGTIHFGIVESSGLEGLLEGKVVGLTINQAKFMEIFYEEMKQSFYKDQVDIVLQCLRPPQFVSVHHKQSTTEGNKPLFVVEVDVVPSYGLTNSDTFYIKERKENHQTVPRIYKFDKNSPKVLLDDDLRTYMATKLRIAEHRKEKEKTSIPRNVCENLREQFLNFYTAGSDKLTNDIYPILFLSPLDSAMNEEFVSENFEFLLNIDPTAIFDFHSSLDKKCLYNFVEADLQRVVKVYTTDNFDRNSDENSNSAEKLNGVLEELRTSQLKPWIFCNGYEPLDKPPLNRLEWKKKRSEGFKEVTRFLQQEIPNERALVIFLIFSKNYDIMLEVAEEVILKFQNQWIAMAENEKLMENWRDELLRRASVDKITLRERCIIGLPWKHLNNIVKEVSNSVIMATKCQLPTSAGAFCYLKEKLRNNLCDLEILSSNECEIDEICHDPLKREKHRRSVEEKFYHGGQVTWWNLYFEQDHVLRRTQQEKIRQNVERLLEPKQKAEDARVPRFYLFHQPGAGGTTTAYYTLWQFRKRFRCCVVKKITDQTCDQIERLRCFEDLDNPKPPIILIDNLDEEKIQDLHARLDHREKTDSRTYCLLFLCVRRANLPNFAGINTVQLKHELSEKELEWLNKKYQTLNERFKNNEGVDPKLLISFNILKGNFDLEYIERTVREFIDSIEIEKEKYLIKYLSLINAYDIDFQSIPLSAFDRLMDQRKNTVVFSMGSVTDRRNRQSNFIRSWENTLSQSTEVLLNRNRLFSGGQALSIVNKLFANAILDYIVGKENISIGNITLEFLHQPLLTMENSSTRQLKKIIQDVLKKRDFTEDLKKEMFSPIILKIGVIEGKDMAANVLETGYNITRDPMLAQQTARFFISVANWEKAERYAMAAVQERPDNSYLWDTYGQIYKKRLTDTYKSCLETGVTPSAHEMKNIVELAMKGIDKFSREQVVSENSRFGRENDAGYFGEVRLIVQLLDLLSLWFPGKDKAELHTHLVNMASHEAFEIFPEESKKFLKNIHARSEKTMQVIEDKIAQLKSDKDGEVFPLNPSYNPRYELVQFRENLDNYLGEQTGNIPDQLGPETRASFIRRRVKRIGGRSISSILDLRDNPDGEKCLDEMFSKLVDNTQSKFSKAYDFVTLITVTIVRNMDREAFSDEDFGYLVEWSRIAYEKTISQGDDERPQLEAYMYFVMIHWPTESKKKFHLNPIENIENAIKRWKNAFHKLYKKQKDDAYFAPRRVTTYYFLGKGNGSKEIVYYKDMPCKQINVDRKTLWRSKEVQKKLQQLEGTLLSDGWDIRHTVTSAGGNKSHVLVRNSYPSPKYLWQKKVNFYLGFSWSGPKAYIQTDSDPQDFQEHTNVKQLIDDEKRLLIPAKQSNHWQDVITHEAYLLSIRKINTQLQEIKTLKRSKNLNSKQKEKIKKESRLQEELNDLRKRRCEFVDR